MATSPECVPVEARGSTQALVLMERPAAPTVGLPIRGKPTRTALELPDDLSKEEWEHIAGDLGSVNGAVQWWWGDWLCKGQDLGFATRKRYDRAEALTGYGRAYLWNLACVSRSVNPHIRREELSWGHHAEVAGLGAEEQQRFLALAAEKKWTRAQLREATATQRRPARARLGAAGCILHAAAHVEKATALLNEAAKKPSPDEGPAPPEVGRAVEALDGALIRIDTELREICEGRRERAALPGGSLAAFLADMRQEITTRRKENCDERRKRNWNPESVVARFQTELLDWIEEQLDLVTAAASHSGRA